MTASSPPSLASALSPLVQAVTVMLLLLAWDMAWAATVNISTDQGNNERRFNNTNYDVFNCTGGTFHVNKPEPNYPLHIDGSQRPAVEVHGGRTLGHLDPAAYRSKEPGGLYVDWNSAAVFTAAVDVHIRDWVFGSPTADNHVWDALRLEGSNLDHLIENVNIWGCRDDAVECDSDTGGTITIRTSLFNDCYTGISATDQQTGRKIYLDRLLLKITDRFPNDNPTNFRGGPMFKVTSSLALVDRPQWIVNNCVFAYEGVPQETNRVAAALSKWSGSGNYLLFMQSPHTGLGGSKPSTFPAIPAGITVLEGQTARNFWNTSVATYLGSTGDTVAPAVPGSPVATATSSSAITFAWSAATDNVGVTGYEVRRNGTTIATVTGTSHTSSGLPPETAYTFAVRARDAAGNWSAWSANASATTAPDTTAPTIPSGPVATATSSSAITFTWSAATDDVGVTGYQVRRNGTTIATVTGTSHTSSSLTPATAYTFAVRARDAAGNWSAWSANASATTPAGTLPTGWSTADVGHVSAAGTAAFASGTWTLRGSGADIWSTADEFRFAWITVTGDVSITATVTSFSAPHAWSKAGVMIRETVGTSSRHAYTCVTGNNGTAFQRRRSTGASSVHSSGPKPSPALPYRVRLERLGDVFISSVSADGVTWTQIRRETISMGTSVQVGLAVTSHADGALAIAGFSGVAINAAPAAPN